MWCLQLLFTPIYTTLERLELRDGPLYLLHGIFNAKLRSNDVEFPLETVGVNFAFYAVNRLD